MVGLLLKASANIFISLVALAALEVKCVCKNPVSVKELFIILWNIKHFSLRRGVCLYSFNILCCDASALSQKSCPKEGGESKLGMRDFDTYKCWSSCLWHGVLESIHN